MSAEQLQSFFESTGGIIITVLVVCAVFFAVALSGGKKKMDTKALVLAALFAALYIILNQIVLFRMPQGGSITADSAQSGGARVSLFLQNH